MNTKLCILAAAALLAACAVPGPRPSRGQAPAPAQGPVPIQPSRGFVYQAPPAAVEAASGFTEKPGWASTKFAVVAANPLATDAG